MVSPPARAGTWPPLYIGGATLTGPSINIPDTRYGFSSPRPARHGQVSFLPSHHIIPFPSLPFCLSNLVEL